MLSGALIRPSVQISRHFVGDAINTRGLPIRFPYIFGPFGTTRLQSTRLPHLPHTTRTMSTNGGGVHVVAQHGFNTGNDLYDRCVYYPYWGYKYVDSHPRKWGIVLVHLINPRHCLTYETQIGAGTGIFTRALLAHPEWSQAVKQLRAVEPSPGMREVFSKGIPDDRVSVSEGTFDTTGVEDGWADLIVIAQAFHWCPDYDKAAVEFSRILKPTGIVALIWNLEDRDAAAWVASLRDRIEPHENGTPQYRLNLWRQMFVTPSYLKLFTSPPEERVWEYTLPGTRDIVIDRANSKSYIQLLPDAEREQVRVDIGAIVDKGEGLVWRNKEEGVFDYPYKTTVVTFNRKE